MDSSSFVWRVLNNLAITIKNKCKQISFLRIQKSIIWGIHSAKDCQNLKTESYTSLIWHSLIHLRSTSFLLPALAPNQRGHVVDSLQAAILHRIAKVFSRSGPHLLTLTPTSTETTSSTTTTPQGRDFESAAAAAKLCAATWRRKTGKRHTSKVKTSFWFSPFLEPNWSHEHLSYTLIRLGEPRELNEKRVQTVPRSNWDWSSALSLSSSIDRPQAKIGFFKKLCARSYASPS